MFCGPWCSNLSHFLKHPIQSLICWLKFLVSDNINRATNIIKINSNNILLWNKRMPHFVFLFVEVGCLASWYSFYSNSETELNCLCPIAVAGVSGDGRHSISETFSSFSIILLSSTLTGTKENRLREAKISSSYSKYNSASISCRRDQKHWRVYYFFFNSCNKEALSTHSPSDMDFTCSYNLVNPLHIMWPICTLNRSSWKVLFISATFVK